MKDYIKQLEAENEELRNTLAEAQKFYILKPTWEYKGTIMSGVKCYNYHIKPLNFVIAQILENKLCCKVNFYCENKNITIDNKSIEYVKKLVEKEFNDIIECYEK